MSVMLYGLDSCDACRKARQWLANQGIEHTFVDLRAGGVSQAHLDRWLADMDWQSLINRRSRTWRELSPHERESLDANTARELMLAHPTLIKRPVLEHATGVLAGFSPIAYQTALAAAD